MDRLDNDDADLISGPRSIIATYRADLSYRPDVILPNMHCFSISIVLTRPGRAADFVEARKIVKAAHEKASVKENYFIYQIESGLPAATFLIVIPYRSLDDLDAIDQVHGKMSDDAIGDEGRRKTLDLTSSGTISSETMIFSLNPEISFVAAEWIAADPDFWAPKRSQALRRHPAAKAAHIFT